MKTRFDLATGLLSAAILAIAPVTFAQDAGEDAIEEIVATGIRGSLEAAADVKRNDARIVDAVVAEDMGKLPDNNIAEALQRITGVSIDSDFGVGDSVSIRGLSQNRVELNGRTTTGDDRDGVSLQDFPSSFLKSVEVIKSPTADMIEGALGGTVRMNTVRPMDLNGLTMAGSLDMEYAGKTEEWGPIFSGSIGNNWDLNNGGQFGAALHVSLLDRTIRQDTALQNIIIVDSSSAFGAALGAQLGPSNGPSADAYQIGNENTVEQWEEKRERTAANLGLQWVPPSGNANFYLDLAYADRDGSQRGNSILEVGGHGANSIGPSTYQDQYGVVQNLTNVGTFNIPKSYIEFRSTETFSNALGFDFDVREGVTISGEISMATSKSSQPDAEFNSRPLNQDLWNAWMASHDAASFQEAFNQDSVNDYLDANGNSVSFNNAYDQQCRGATGTTDGSGLYNNFGCRNTFDIFQFNNGGIPSVDYMGSDALTNPRNLALRQFKWEDVRTTNDETAVRFDIDWANAFGMDSLTSLKAGVRFTENDFEFIENQFDTGSSLYRRTFDTTTGLPHVVFVDQFMALFPGTYNRISHPNSFDQHGLSGPNGLLDYLIYDDLNNPEATFQRFAQVMAGSTEAVTGTLADNLEFQDDLYRDIKEDTSAIYISGEFDFDRWSAVVGARYTSTDITSSTFVDGELTSETNEYNDFLPSLNLTYHLTDQTLLRFAAAKVIRRPDYTDLSPTFDVSGAITVADRGSARLDPFRATQFDLSVEHYFDDGGLVSFAVFYKDVESFLNTTATCEANPLTVSSPQNVSQWRSVCLLDTAGVGTGTSFRFADQTLPDDQGLAVVAGLRDQGLTGVVVDTISNGRNGTIQGFELGVQKHFDDLPGIWSGLGVSANYTYADSEQPNGNTLLDISKDTYNVQVYWEGESLQARLAYNYRSKFLNEENTKRVLGIGARGLLGSDEATEGDPAYDPTAGNSYDSDRGQLDFSASWNFSDTLTLVGSATNLLGEPVSYETEIGNTWRWIESDQRYSIGIRATFE